MVDLSNTYLLPFDPEDTGEPFGFLRTDISGRDQWWFVQVWAGDDPDETIMVRFFEQAGPCAEMSSEADFYRGRPWLPIGMPSDDLPHKFSPSHRVRLDMPGGRSLTHEWGPAQLSEEGRKCLLTALSKSFEEVADV